MTALSKARNFAFYTIASIITLVMGTLGLPALLSRRLAQMGAQCWLRQIFFLLRIIYRIDFKVIGKENIPKCPFIVACKHQSVLETLILPFLIPNPIFIIKKEMLYVPFLGICLKATGAIHVDRSKGRKAISYLQRQLLKLSKEDCPVIFPEGTRANAGIRITEYPSGIAMIYETLKLPVLPIAVNTGMFWPKSGELKPGTAIIKILPAIVPKKYNRKQFLKQLNEIIENNSIELYKFSLSKHHQRG